MDRYFSPAACKSNSKDGILEQKTPEPILEGKKQNKHKIGWSDSFLSDPLFSSGVQYNSAAYSITCSLWQKHPHFTTTLGENKQKNYISGVDGSSICRDTLCRHADSSGHQNAVKAERAAKLPNANRVGAVLKMSSQNIADVEIPV